jgi:hypothetical protein
MLDQATNVNTGKLNIRAFEQQLRRSGLSLRDFAVELNKLGPAG